MPTLKKVASKSLQFKHFATRDSLSVSFISSAVMFVVSVTHLVLITAKLSTSWEVGLR